MMYSTALKANKQHGIGLIELMLVLLIIVIIVFTSTYYFRVTNENLRVTQTEEIINNIVDSSYKWLVGNPNFSGINMGVLEDAGFIPKSYETNPWKGSITIGPDTNDNSKLAVKVSDIPVKSCNNLAEKMKKYAPNANCIINLNSQLADFNATF